MCMQNGEGIAVWNFEIRCTDSFFRTDFLSELNGRHLPVSRDHETGFLWQVTVANFFPGFSIMLGSSACSQCRSVSWPTGIIFRATICAL